MKKFLTVALAALLIAVGWIATADAAYYFFQIKDEQGRAITSGFRCQVYTVASRTADAIFSDTNYGTRKTNPIDPDSNGVCAFATSNTTVDVLVYGHSGSARGAVARVNDLTDTSHTIVLDTSKPDKAIRFYFDRDISKGAETDTGIDLPVGALVSDVWVEAASVMAGGLASVSVGLLSTEASGDTDGFCVSQGLDIWGAGAFVTQADSGFFRCEASRSRLSAISTLQGQEPFAYVSNTRGVLLASFTRGQTTGAAVSPSVGLGASGGQYQEYPHLVRPGSATSIVYQTNDRGAYGGWVTIFYRELWRKK